MKTIDTSYPDTLEIEFACCGTAYLVCFPQGASHTLRIDLRDYEVVRQVFTDEHVDACFAIAEEVHDQQHPECEDK